MIGIVSYIVFALVAPLSVGGDADAASSKPRQSDPAPPSFCSDADLNFDGTVDERDLEDFVLSWCKRGSDADINDNGVVDKGDILLFGQILDENLCD